MSDSHFGKDDDEDSNQDGMEPPEPYVVSGGEGGQVGTEEVADRCGGVEGFWDEFHPCRFYNEAGNREGEKDGKPCVVRGVVLQ